MQNFGGVFYFIFVSKSFLKTKIYIMATVKKSFWAANRKALVISAIAAAAIFFLIPLATFIDRNNDWKTIDEFILISPSVRQSVGWAMESGGVIFGVLFFAVVGGLAIGFGSQDRLPFALFGGSKGDIFTTIAIAGVCIIATLIIYNGKASNYRNNTYYTVKAADFDADKAARGQYDANFHDPFQADPLRPNFSK